MLCVHSMGFVSTGFGASNMVGILLVLLSTTQKEGSQQQDTPVCATPTSKPKYLNPNPHTLNSKTLVPISICQDYKNNLHPDAPSLWVYIEKQLVVPSRPQ